MRITHFLNEEIQETKESEECGFMLSNRDGDYLWLNEKPKSRYEGWFAALRDNLYKVIENIEVEEAGSILEIRNNFHYVERRREKLKELFFLPQSAHTLIYELTEKRKVNVFLDMRESYSHEDPTDYEVEVVGESLLVKFSNGFFLAVRCEKGLGRKDNFLRYYELDKKRNSKPFERKVFHGLALYGKRFVFAIAQEKEEALREANKLHVRNTTTGKGDLDVLCAEKSLADLLSMKPPGIYAGFPWFFQFWPRDEAISLRSVLKIEEEKGKAIFLRLLESALESGPRGRLNMDAPGWIFKRLEDVLPLMGEVEKERIRKTLKEYLEDLLLGFTEDGLNVNKPQETWMDSLNRSGARIELQAMRLNMYRLASNLAKRRGERNFYMKLESEMRRKVRSLFFDGTILFDGYCPSSKEIDKDIRPNIFIAAYIYPHLLKKSEWQDCFDSALSHLWLLWGGVATLDKSSSKFYPEHTGEDAKSYHNGDSWFYLNNLVAIVLYRTNKKKYASYIKKIMKASKEELMWKGVIGAHTEISSASENRSEGCLNQAWSNALYLEAKREIDLNLL